MELKNNLFDYLKERISTFEKTTKKGAFLFTCPNIANHKYIGKSPTATIINGTEKINCLQCGWKGTFYDIVHLLEPDKKDYTDGQIIEYLTNTLDINVYSEFDEYKKYGWHLFVICKNAKVPVKDEHWREKEFCFVEKSKWLGWIDGGYNLAVNCEFSKVMIVDFDDKNVEEEFIQLRDEFKELLDKSKTLMQNTPHAGKHYVFQYDKELCFKQRVNLGGGLKIDTRTHKGYFLVSPSKVDNVTYNWVNLGVGIKVVPEDLKNKLLEIINNEKGTSKQKPLELPQPSGELLKLKNNNLEGCCNDTFVRLGGILINRLSPEQVEFALSVFNTQLLENPMPSSAIKNMLCSLEGYKQTEAQTQEQSIYDCVKLIKMGIHAKDIIDHTGIKRAIVDKYLSKFNQEGILVRRGRGIYDFKEKVEWTDTVPEKTNEYPYKIPYFNDIAYFCQGDIILIGAPTGKGKTHIALNLIKQMKEQGVKPYYVSLESGSRYLKIAKYLKLEAKDFYVPKVPIDSPTQIEIEPNSFTIIDWLYTGDDFAATQSIFKHLSDEMRRKDGILVVFTQLKEDYSYFAVNLIKSFARLAARHVYDDMTGVISHFEVDKITDPKGHYQTTRVDTEFNFDTKELKKKEIK